MHMLGHSFSQRRKSPTKPRDLHIRKVSFSGSSLSSASGSACSFSSSSSTSTARAQGSPASHRAGSDGGFDPLHLHPTFQPPPRLYDRPLIRAESQRYDDDVSSSTFYCDEDDGEDNGSLDEYLDHYLDNDGERDAQDQPPADMELPPHTSPMDHDTHDTQEPQDYFFFQLTQRPPMPRSRWSESTIQTLEQLTPGGGPGGSLTPGAGGMSDSEPREDGARHLNFSWKRATVPKRPPIRTMDSFDNYIKRGGWKRRGIVFNHSEMEKNEVDSGFAG